MDGEDEPTKMHDAVIFNVETLSSKRVLECEDIFYGDIQQIADGNVVIWDDLKIGRFTLKGEQCTFEILQKPEDWQDSLWGK